MVGRCIVRSNFRTEGSTFARQINGLMEQGSRGSRRFASQAMVFIQPSHRLLSLFIVDAHGLVDQVSPDRSDKNYENRFWLFELDANISTPGHSESNNDNHQAFENGHRQS